jgi:hypothetical protein
MRSGAAGSVGPINGLSLLASVNAGGVEMVGSKWMLCGSLMMLVDSFLLYCL